MPLGWAKFSAEGATHSGGISALGHGRPDLGACRALSCVGTTLAIVPTGLSAPVCHGCHVGPGPPSVFIQSYLKGGPELLLCDPQESLNPPPLCLFSRQEEKAAVSGGAWSPCCHLQLCLYVRGTVPSPQAPPGLQEYVPGFGLCSSSVPVCHS